MLTPNLAEARRFLGLISNSKRTFQILPESEGAKDQRPFILHDPTVEKLGYLNQNGFGIFLMINQGDGNGRKNANVEKVRGFFSDFDKSDLPRHWPLEPSIIVQTSANRHHAYWLLDEPITLGISTFNQIQEQISVSVGAEPTDTRDLCRVMRVAGFYHQKQEPYLSIMLRPENGVEAIRYSVKHICQAFRIELNSLNKTRMEAKTYNNQSPSNQPLNFLEQAITEIEAAREGSRRSVLNKHAFKAGMLIRDGKIDHLSVETSLISSGLSTGLPADEVIRTVKQGIEDGIKSNFAGNRNPRQNSKTLNSNDQKESQAKKLLGFIMAEEVELWHDAEKCYLSVNFRGALRHYRTTSPGARVYAKYIYYQRTADPINDHAVNETLGLIDALALHSGNQYQSSVRSGHQDGTTYIDLGDEESGIIEISKNDWKMIESSGCPVRFVKPAALQILPEPVVGGDLDALKLLLNVDRKSFVLCVAWLLSAFSGISPYPVLIISGEQGSGKSTLASVLRGLVDPSRADRRRIPKNEQDLFIAAQHTHVLSFENVSSVPDWLSDSLCAMSTGGVFSTRRLYSDSEESLLEAKRPVILNGIPDLVSRPDLADRSVFIWLKQMDQANRIPEQEFWRIFEERRPQILGALCEALAFGLSKLEMTTIQPQPRMLDFARLVVAAEPKLPWAAGEFLDVYVNMDSEAALSLIEGDHLGMAVRTFIDDHISVWEGGIQQLLDELSQRLSGGDHRQRPLTWPATARALGNDLRRLAPPLKKLGYAVEFLGRGTGGARRCRLSKTR